MTFSQRILWGTILLLFLITAGLWLTVWGAAPRGVLTFAVMDVGQGDSLYIESPTGIQVVVDGGPNAALLRELPKLMPYGDRTIDAVIETHPDADHIGGFVDLLHRYKVGAFIDPGVSKSTATNNVLEHEISELKIPRYLAREGMALNLGSGAQLIIFYPDHDVSGLPENRTNEGGVVAKLVYGESEVLLTADVPVSVESQLLENSQELQSDILKVGHHGSKTSTSENFLNAVNPQIAIISVGEGNRYGHPTQEVLDRLAAFGAKIFRTDENGTVRCVSDGAKFKCEL